MSDRWIVVDAAGTVEAVTMGQPVELPPGRSAYPAPEGSDVSLGWVRNGDGSLSDGRAAAPPTKADLVAYTKATRAALVDTRLIPVLGEDGVEYPLPIEIQTRTALTAGTVQVREKPDYRIKSWTFVDGRVRSLGKVDILAFSDAADAAFQHVFDRQALCLAGIADGSVTTTAQIDAILKG